MINMINANGEGSCKATCEVEPLDSIDSLPALRVSQLDNGDVSSPSSRYSSCGESDFDRYCSANSIMGTPSMCSTITVFNDFTEYDNSGLENFSLEERGEINSKDQSPSSSGASDSMRDLRTGFSENVRTEQNSKFVSSGLELYGDDDAFAIPMLDASGFVVTKTIPMLDASGFVVTKTNQLENVLDQSYIRNDFEVSEVSKQKELGGDKDCLETLSSDGSDDAGTTEKYVLGDVNRKCSQSLPTVGGEYEISGRESNLQIGETTGSNIDKPQVQDADKLVNCPKTCFTSFTTKDYKVGVMLAEEAPKYMTVNVDDYGTVAKGNLHMNTEETIGTSDAQHVENPELDNSKIKFDNLFNSKVDLKFFSEAIHTEKINAESFENLAQVVPSSNCGMSKTLDNSSTSANLSEKNPMISKIENFELKELYEDVVHEMEEILLNSVDSPGSRLAQGNRLLEPQLSIPLRDGGLAASASSRDDSCLLVQNPMSMNRIEVVGARRKKGDVSFSGRLVGVKEYTVYKIKVWSGEDQWEIERRYRDFVTLYHCLKALFTEQGRDLPFPWSIVEKETKKIFRSASLGVIVQRSVLLQECLQSILHIRFFSSPPSALIWFLSPPGALISHSFFTRVTNNRDYSSLLKPISLIVEIPPCKSMKQMLAAQQNSCAGCRKFFDYEKTLIWDFVRTFGWGKPRLCEYTGQLFCSSCHTNETAVLPARVLHHWDFTHYAVSQLAKSYLDSINDEPMLCVTAVNPILLSKVPALRHVMRVRKKIGTMLPYVLCPFRTSINRGLGTRRYLLESNDFFALRDLIDLSKGAFAALPMMVETVSRKILKHITDQCIICGDVGLPCSARQDCSDPCSLIFPFQEDEIERCTDCQSIFHEPCFRKLANCSCGRHLRLTNGVKSEEMVKQATLDSLGIGLRSGLSSGFPSGLFTKRKA